MRAGTALWLAGWLFVVGVVSIDDGEYVQPGWKVCAISLVAWPMALGLAASKYIETIEKENR